MASQSFPVFSDDIRRIEDLDSRGRLVAGDASFAVPPFIAETDIALSSEISEPYSRKSASKIQKWIRLEKEEIADDCAAWNICFEEDAETTPDDILKADAASRKTAAKIAAVLDGYESQTGLCLLYETIKSFSLNDSHVRKLFSDNQINSAVERLAAYGWADKKSSKI